MKAISLWQPWASLIATGAKTFETRGWPTTYRGPLAIHAARRDTTDIRALMHNWQFQGGLAPLMGKPVDYETKEWYGVTWEMLPKGAILCIVNVLDCIATQGLKNGDYYKERYFGDYTPGRFAWKLELVEVLKKPIETKGSQGFFEYGI
jgi:hypothetical protein